MELNERIKKARKMQGYKSRDALAEALGSTRDAIASYELGRVVPNDVFLQLMAAKLNLSYEWLKEGKGEMEAKPSSIDAIIEKLDASDVEIVRIYAELPPEHKRILKDFARKIAATQKATPKTTLTIDEKVEAYRAELEAEEKTKARSSASPGAGEESA